MSLSAMTKTIDYKYADFLAHVYYDEKTYMHACRVMKYVSENDLIPEHLLDSCIILALMHDLLEDTVYTPDETVPEDLVNALRLISKPDNMDYVDYIRQIRNTQGVSWRECVYWVKLADIKDHLMQRETLTDRLKEKYLEAIPYLL